MRSRWYAAIGVAISIVPRIATAEDPSPRPFELAASIGYAGPLGDAERGGRLSDTDFAVVPLAFDAAYRLAPRIGLAARLQYGVGIPTLCHTAGDCESSLGSDIVATMGARIDLPERRTLAPVVDAGIGYEWLTTRLSDAGAHSTRAYNGPLLFWLGLVTPFRLAGHWSLGPAANLFVGTFTTRSLETNVASITGGVPERAVHAWVSLGCRLARTF